MPTNNNKLVARNAVALTFRMILVTIVGIYTSRIVLEALGVEDYGIYGVVGGVVGMASFLNVSMSGATSRFITFELGRGDEGKLKKIFSTALIIHLIIALVVAVLAETVGLWFLNNKMVIPSDRMFAANILYQFSVFSVVMGFTQVPYTAVIIGHERMSVYAYIEIINVVFKLIIAILTIHSNYDRLILYGALTFCVSIVIAFCYRIYCIRNFPEAHFHHKVDKQLAKSMLNYSMLDLYGNMCYGVNNQGRPILLNLFFGVVANAAASISATVTGIIYSLTATILQAFRPQIIKKYAIGDFRSMEIIMRRATQFTIFAYSCIAIPLYINTSQILYLWLGQIPEYTVEFMKITIISTIIVVIPQVNNAALHATGDIRRISFISGSVYLTTLLFSYVWLKNGGSANTPYILFVINNIIVALLSWCFIKIQIPDINCSGLIRACTSSIIVTIGSYAFIIALYSNVMPNMLIYTSDQYGFILLKIFTTYILSLILLSVSSLLFSFNKDERLLILSKGKNFFNQFKL